MCMVCSEEGPSKAQPRKSPVINSCRTPVAAAAAAAVCGLSRSPHSSSANYSPTAAPSQGQCLCDIFISSHATLGKGCRQVSMCRGQLSDVVCMVLPYLTFKSKSKRRLLYFILPRLDQPKNHPNSCEKAAPVESICVGGTRWR